MTGTTVVDEPSSKKTKLIRVHKYKPHLRFFTKNQE